MVDLLRIETNERIDLEDFEAVTNAGVEATQELANFFLTNPYRQRAWVVKGFLLSNPSGKQLTVTGGWGILSYRDQGIVKTGAIVPFLGDTKTVDLTTYPSATYNVYIRFEWVDDDIKSRIFWDPSGDGAEFAQTVATRHTASWSVRVEASSPGSEWLKIGTVVQSTMVLTNMQPYFFEGDPSASYQSGWSTEGGGNSYDRHSNRSVYGVGDLQMFTAAMRQCLKDIKGRGLREWYSKDIGGINVGFDTDPTEAAVFVKDLNFGLDFSGTDPQLKLSSSEALQVIRATNRIALKVAGSSRVQVTNAAILPTTDDAIDLGGSGNEWKDLYVDGTIYADVLNLATGATQGSYDLWPITNGAYDLGDPARVWASLFSNDAYLQAGNLYIGLPAGDHQCWSINASDTFSIWVRNNSWGSGQEIIKITRAEDDDDTVQIHSDVIPETDLVFNLGSDDVTTPLRWAKVVAQRLHLRTTTSGASMLDFYDGQATAGHRSWRLMTSIAALNLQIPPDNFSTSGETAFTLVKSDDGSHLKEMMFHAGSSYPVHVYGDSDRYLHLGKSDKWIGDLYAYNVVCTKLRMNDAATSGVSGYLTFGAGYDTGGGANGTLGPAGGNANAGWLIWYLGTSAIYVPYWSAIT